MPAVPITPLRRVAIATAGFLGAAGVAAAALSSHAGATLLGPLSLVALTHAPALLALGLKAPPPSRLLDGAAMVLALGALLFCADLAARHALAAGLFPMSAPLGGGLLIAGWALVVLAAFFTSRR